MKSSEAIARKSGLRMLGGEAGFPDSLGLVAGGAVDVEVIFAGAGNGDIGSRFEAAEVGDDVANFGFGKIGEAGRSDEGPHRRADAAVPDGLEDVVVGSDREESGEADSGSGSAGGVSGALGSVAGGAVGVEDDLAVGVVTGDLAVVVDLDVDGMVVAGGVEVGDDRVDLVVAEVGPRDHRGAGTAHANGVANEFVAGEGEKVAIANAGGEPDETGRPGLVAGDAEGVVDLLTFEGEVGIGTGWFRCRRLFLLLRGLVGGGIVGRCLTRGIVGPGRVRFGARELVAENDSSEKEDRAEDDEKAMKVAIRRWSVWLPRRHRRTLPAAESTGYAGFGLRCAKIARLQGKICKPPVRTCSSARWRSGSCP